MKDNFGRISKALDLKNPGRMKRLKKLEGSIDFWVKALNKERPIKDSKISSNKISRSKQMTDIHSKAFHLIRTQQIFNTSNKHNDSDQPDSSKDSVNENIDPFTERFTAPTRQLIRRANENQSSKPNELRILKELNSSPDAYIHPLPQNFHDLTEEFLKIDQLYIEICTNENRVKSPILPQNYYASLLKISSAYEQKFDKLFSFIQLKKILAVSDLFFKVRVLKEGVGFNDMSKYYFELREFNNYTELQYNPQKQADLFKKKISELLKIKYDEFSRDKKIRINLFAGVNWNPKFDPSEVYDNLNYVFPILEYDKTFFENSTHSCNTESDDYGLGMLSTKHKVELLREKVLKKIKKRNDELLSTPIDMLPNCINRDMVLDVAEKIQATMSMKKVSNMYLTTLVNHLENKNCLKYNMDSHEIVTAIRKISDTMPLWLQITDYKGTCLIKMASEFSINQVVKYLKTHYKSL